MEVLKGVGYALGVMILVVLMVVPNPVGKIVEIWRFFRGDWLD
jgi:hypothetical protein